MPKSAKDRRQLPAAIQALHAHAGELYRLRRKLPDDAKRFASNLIEQIYVIERRETKERKDQYLRGHRDAKTDARV